jgi:hypothetical protein
VDHPRRTQLVQRRTSRLATAALVPPPGPFEAHGGKLSQRPVQWQPPKSGDLTISPRRRLVTGQYPRRDACESTQSAARRLIVHSCRTRHALAPAYSIIYHSVGLRGCLANVQPRGMGGRVHVRSATTCGHWATITGSPTAALELVWANLRRGRRPSAFDEPPSPPVATCCATHFQGTGG